MSNWDDKKLIKKLEKIGITNSIELCVALFFVGWFLLVLLKPLRLAEKSREIGEVLMYWVLFWVGLKFGKRSSKKT